MKKLLLAIVLSTSLLFSTTFTGCEVISGVAGSLGLSEIEMIAGLKEALTQGLFVGFDAFARQDQGNPLVRFAFPGESAKIEKTLKDLGLTSLVNNATAKFTNAMALAVKEAKPIFVNSIKRMNFRDVTNILITDNKHAATQFFKSAMTPELMTAFRPIVDSTVRTTGAGKDYDAIARIYNTLPFLEKKLEPNLNEFIAGRAIDAMFLYVANEEENIREKIEFRKTDLMKRVFGYADQQLRNRAGANSSGGFGL